MSRVNNANQELASPENNEIIVSYCKDNQALPSSTNLQ